MASNRVSAEQAVTPEFLAAQTFEALLHSGEVSELEALATGFGRNRRLVYAVLSRSKAALLETAEQPEGSFDSYIEMLDAVDEYQKHLGDLKEQAESARVRILSMLATLHSKIENGGALT